MSNSVSPQEPRWEGVREVMVMSWPIILGSLSYTVMEFVDKWMVAKLGTDEIAAVGAAGIWSFTLGTVIIGIVGCVSTFVGQSIGRGQKENCGPYAWQGIWISFGAIVVALALYPLSGPLFRSMGHGENVTRLELAYFHIRLIGYLPLAWMTALAAFFQAINRPRVPMYVAIAANACNIVLNYLLIFGACGFPRWGVAGAATATVISQGLQVLLLQTVFMGPRIHREYNTRGCWRPDMRRIRELVRIGIPAGMSFMLDIANWSIFTSYVVGRFGSTQLAAHVIAISFIHVCFMPAVAVNQGIAAIVSQWLGRRDVPRAKARTYTAIKLSMAYMVCMGTFFAFFGGDLIGAIFSDDAEVISLGRKLLILAAFFQAFDAVNIICMGALRGAGDTRWMMYAMFVVAYLFFLPLALTLSIGLNGQAFGAWVAATIYITVLSGVLFYRFYGEQWRHMKIFEDDRN